VDNCYLIVGASTEKACIDRALKEIRKRLETEARILKAEETPPVAEGDTLFLLLSDEEYRREVRRYAELPVRLVFLPTSSNPRLKEDFLIPDDLKSAVELAAPDAATTPLRTLTLCNGEVLQGEATLGEAEWLRNFPFLKWLIYFLRHLGRLRLRPFRIETAKGQSVETAALILPVAHERIRARKRPYFFGKEENQCNRVAAVIYAPLSLFSIFRLRIYLYRPGRARSVLPPGVGTLRSRRLEIRSTKGPVPLTYNGRKEYVARALFENIETRAEILLPEEPCVAGDPDKESLKLRQIPTDKELVDFYTRRRLPLVPIASESLFADLFATLREGARIGTAYLLLLIVSVLMATTGLFQNSAPTIIGAMILAPLMAPIISFSMGVMRFDGPLIRTSARTLGISILLALGTAALLAGLLPFTHLTDQMAMRTHPTLLDLAVAILSGIAAAYGTVNSKVGQSLAGVAIAVALVPPLSVAGIGLGWGDYGVFEGAFLLFLANFAGIITAAGAVFYLLGFTSWRYASSAFVIKMLLLIAIAVPLWLSTRTLLQEERIHRAFDTLKQIDFAGKKIRIDLKRIYRIGDELYAEVTVLLPRNHIGGDRNEIAEIIRKRIGKGTRLILSYRYLY
jgi:uncharacterized hydrophobic protein (TIGR00271 family)